MPADRNQRKTGDTTMSSQSRPRIGRHESHALITDRAQVRAHFTQRIREVYKGRHEATA